MGVVELETSCDFRRVRIGSAAETVHPGLGSGDCENESMVDASWGAIASPRGLRSRGARGLVGSFGCYYVQKIKLFAFSSVLQCGLAFPEPKG